MRLKRTSWGTLVISYVFPAYLNAIRSGNMAEIQARAVAYLRQYANVIEPINAMDPFAGLTRSSLRPLTDYSV